MNGNIYKDMKKVRIIVLTLAIVVFAAGHASAQQNTFNGLIISWEQKEITDANLRVRVKEAGTGAWTEWYGIKADADIDEKEHIGANSKDKNGWIGMETLFSTNKSTDMQYRAGAGVRAVKFEKIFSNNAGRARLFSGLNFTKSVNVISRNEWGANENLTVADGASGIAAESNGNTLSDTSERSEITEEDPEIVKVIKTDPLTGKPYKWPLQYAADIKFIVIHHTASIKNLDDPKTAIQNILYYHAVRRGWGDIGYNYIIDPAGRIYEGRKGGDGVVGGHALPLNKISVGIAVLGNYENGEVPSRVLNSIGSLIKSKAGLHNIDVDGRTAYKDKIYPNVQGHFENSATMCPGTFLKQKLPGMRSLVAYTNVSHDGFRDYEPRGIIAAAPGQEKEFSLRLKNTGAVAWGAGTFLERTDDDGAGAETGIPKIIARLATPSVAPGYIGIFKGNIPAMFVSGLRTPSARLVVNASIRSKETMPIPVMVEAIRASYEIVEIVPLPETMFAGSRAETKITLKNTGNITWKRYGANKITLDAANPAGRQSDFFIGRMHSAYLLQKEVKPGETGTFTMRFKAPEQVGVYYENFQPVIRGGPRLGDENMIKFTIIVDSAPERDVRVKISFFGDEVILRGTSNETIIKLAESGYKVNGAITPDPPRFKSSSADGILEISNLNRKDNKFRGIIEIRNINGKLTIINELPLEDYLKGIAEVPNDSHKEKIKTIIILARSYAAYYRDIARKFPGMPYDLDDDPAHTQKYLGYGFESRAGNVAAAVQETRGKIVTFEGQKVITPYFHQSDGRTRSAEEIWRWTDKPYLVSVPDAFCGTTELQGHGVGLSGCGATALAQQGKTAEEIIKYYYKGVELTD